MLIIKMAMGEGRNEKECEIGKKKKECVSERDRTLIFKIGLERMNWKCR